MAKHDDVQERLIDFAAAVIRLCGLIPKTPSGIFVADQLLRSGTSPAAKYAESRWMERKSDGKRRLATVVNDLNESLIWLKIVERANLASKSIVEPLENECAEIAVTIRVGSEGGKTSSGIGRGSKSD